MGIPVASIGGGGGSSWTRVIALDRIEQLGNMLLSGLIHLDHCPLKLVKGKSLVSLVFFYHLIFLCDPKFSVSAL